MPIISVGVPVAINLRVPSFESGGVSGRELSHLLPLYELVGGEGDIQREPFCSRLQDCVKISLLTHHIIKEHYQTYCFDRMFFLDLKRGGRGDGYILYFINLLNKPKSVLALRTGLAWTTRGQSERRRDRQSFQKSGFGSRHCP